MAVYAKDTKVSSERSRAEIERTLQRYGASRFLYAWEPGQAIIAFEAHGRRLKFTLPLPDRSSRALTHTPSRGHRRSPQQHATAYEQAVQQRWRALALVIKAKLEAIASGITTFEAEFLSHILLPDGRTVGEAVQGDIETAYRTGQVPALLGGLAQRALPQA